MLGGRGDDFHASGGGSLLRLRGDLARFFNFWTRGLHGNSTPCPDTKGQCFGQPISKQYFLDVHTFIYVSVTTNFLGILNLQVL